MYLILNFKENKNFDECKKYLSDLSEFLQNFNPGKIQLIIAPPFPYLQLFNESLSKFDFVGIASQDVSKFTNGAYTGEVSASQVKDFSKFCIVGHSERRKNFNESVLDVDLKIGNCVNSGLEPIVCFSNLEQLTGITNLEKSIIAYEPIDFIGGNEAISKQSLTEFYRSTGLSKKIIYGGSVNEENILRFVGIDFISGLLVGGASLDVNRVVSMIKLLQTV